MARPEEKDGVLERMAGFELGLSELYAAFAGAYPSRRRFWTEISAEEKAHAVWIGILKEKVAEGAATLRDGVAPETLRISKSFVDGKLAATRSGELSDRDALAAALVLEKGAVERSCFDVFESLDDEVRAILARLIERTREHIRSIEKLWDDSYGTGA